MVRNMCLFCLTICSPLIIFASAFSVALLESLAFCVKHFLYCFPFNSLSGKLTSLKFNLYLQ